MATRIITVAGSVERETQVASQLATDHDFDLTFRCLDRAELLASLRAGSLDAAICIGVVPWFDFQCLEEADRARVRLFGMAADPIEADMLEVAGFTVVRDVAHLNDLLATSSPIHSSSSPRLAPGKIVAVWGPKGAPGRSTVAIELAAVLAQTDPSSLLVDADLYGGDIAQLLGVAEEVAGIVPLCRMAARGELRDDRWMSELRRAPMGPVLVPGVLRAELWGEVSLFGWTRFLDAARACFRSTVIDIGFCLESGAPGGAGPGRNDVAIAAVEAADRIVAVLRADPVGLRSFFWSFSDHKDVLDRDKCVFVVNRVRPGEEAELARFVRRQLGCPALALIPDRPDHLARSVWEGLPVVVGEPGSPVSDAIREIAADLGAKVPPRGFLSRLAGRRTHA